MWTVNQSGYASNAEACMEPVLICKPQDCVIFTRIVFLYAQLFVHDTGGGERFRTLTANFFRNTQAVILVYSIEDVFTFDNLTLWVEECHNNLGSEEIKSLVWVVVGNKVDEPRGQLTNDRVLEYCKQIHAIIKFETSAKTGENVMEMFQDVAMMVHKVNGNKQAAKMPKQHKLHGTTTNPIANTPKRFCNII